MVEKIIENVINEMVSHLEEAQLEHLKNVLYINFHGLEVQEQCTDIVPVGVDGDAAKIKMFVASEKAINRQDNTLKQYTREIRNMLNFLGKRIENITGMDLIQDGNVDFADTVLWRLGENTSSGRVCILRPISDNPEDYFHPVRLYYYNDKRYIVRFWKICYTFNTESQRAKAAYPLF